MTIPIESARWHPYDVTDSTTFPLDGGQVIVGFADDSELRATFFKEQPGHFSFFNAPFGKPGTVVKWRYSHWDESMDQIEGAV